MDPKSLKPVLATLLVAFFLFGCNKEKPATEPQTNTPQMTAADCAVMNRIVSFRKKVEYKKAHPAYKSGEVVAIDSARWDVETNFNATWAFPDERYLATRHDSAVLFLPVIDDSTTLIDDVLAFNDQCFSQVLALYNSSPFTNKELLFVSLKKGEMAKGELEVKLKVVTGEKQTTTYTWEPFGEGDEWIYGYNQGKCDGSFYLESDAAKQLMEVLNNNRPIYQVGPPYRIVYALDPKSPYPLEGNEYDENGEYLIFYIEKTGDLTDEDKCLDVDEMNFHYNGETTVIYDKMPVANGKPANWDFISCEIEGRYDQYEKEPNIAYNRIRHINKLTYAYRYLVSIAEVGEPTSMAK